jgi:hypothetical protein
VKSAMVDPAWSNRGRGRDGGRGRQSRQRGARGARGCGGHDGLGSLFGQGRTVTAEMRATAALGENRRVASSRSVVCCPEVGIRAAVCGRGRRSVVPRNRVRTAEESRCQWATGALGWCCADCQRLQGSNANKAAYNGDC